MTLTQRFSKGFLSTHILFAKDNSEMEELGITVEEEVVWFKANIRVSDISTWCECCTDDDTQPEFGMTKVYMSFGDLFIIQERYEKFKEWMLL